VIYVNPLLPLRFPFIEGKISFFAFSISVSAILGPFCVNDSTIPEGEDDRFGGGCDTGCDGDGVTVFSEVIDDCRFKDIIYIVIYIVIYCYILLYILLLYNLITLIALN
jgi:hypothetical protein